MKIKIENGTIRISGSSVTKFYNGYTLQEAMQDFQTLMIKIK